MPTYRNHNSQPLVYCCILMTGNCEVNGALGGKSVEKGKKNHYYFNLKTILARTTPLRSHNVSGKMANCSCFSSVFLSTRGRCLCFQKMEQYENWFQSVDGEQNNSLKTVNCHARSVSRHARDLVHCKITPTTGLAHVLQRVWGFPLSRVHEIVFKTLNHFYSVEPFL